MAGFAGSQHSDERRRRRLAVEQDFPRRSTTKEGSSPFRKRLDGTKLVEMHVAKLIPTAIWKYLLAACLLIFATTGLLSAGSMDPQWIRIDMDLFRALQRRAVDVVGGLSLLAAAQCSLLIRRIRGRSLNDFDGRYRLWNWVSLGCGFLGLSTLLSCRDALSEFAAHLFQQPLLAKNSLTWQISALLLGAILLLALRREMRDSRWTYWLLHVSAVCYAVAISAEMIPWELPFQGISLEQAAVTYGHVVLLATFALHARYVVHVNSEPAVSVISPFRVRLPRTRIPSLRLPAFRFGRRKTIQNPIDPERPADNETVSDDDNGETVANPTGANPTGASSPMPANATKPSKRRKTRIEPAHAEATRQPPSTKLKTSSCKGKVECSDDLSKQHAAEIEAVSTEELKGLSKKQRRQLRKQRREEQRARQNR